MISLNEILLITPELFIVGFSLIILLSDLIFGSKFRSSDIASLGILASLIITILLFSGVIKINDISSISILNIISVDKYSLLLKIVVLLLSLSISTAGKEVISDTLKLRSEFWTLFMISLAGMMMLTSVTEMITAWVALELTSLPLIGMLSLNKKRYSLEISFKYLILSATSSAIILMGISQLYGLSGSTFFNDIMPLKDAFGGKFIFEDSTQLLIIFSLILIISGFSFKIASFPFFTWVPDVYQGSPSLVTLYLSVVSKIAGFSILIRFLFESVNIEVYSNISLFIAIISSISMFYGNIMALRQNDLKRLFAYSTIAHAGYILIGIASLQVNDASFSGINSTVFYLIAYGITNLTAFLSMISLSRYVDSYNMLDFKGLGSAQRYQSIIFSISLISLLGIPATVGFMGKAFIFSGAISNDYFWLASFGIINSLISAYYYMKVIKIIFVEKSDKPFPEITFPRLKVITTIGAILIIVLGLAPVALLSIVESALNTII